MKKFFSISLVLLILTVNLHLTVATHYCGGNVAALKVSLTGKLASCGLECMEKDYPSTETNLFRHCCHDFVTLCATDNNYAPSFRVIPNLYRYNLQVFNIPKGLPLYPYAVFTSIYTNVSPHDEFISTSVDLSDICIFRI